MVTLTSELAQRIPPTHKVSFEEYIEWLDEDTRAEWVDGEIALMSPATFDHQNCGGFLHTVLNIFVQAHDLGHIVFAPYVMKLASISRGREPDIIFVRKDREHLLTRHYLDGPADMAVEIVSPDSRRRDRKEKFKEYEAAGVLEYWILEPDHELAEFYQLDDDDRYRRVEIGADGIYRSKVIPGFWLKVEWLWQTPAPLEVLRELKVL
ncbi:MAG TPA: Uma2 family endonuclease [Blastocatellia bacterium]|nr:Uma2 family endonuclease [Blastocatellia bacterium]